MKNKVLNRYYLCSLAGVLIASFYPIWMGVKVVSDMIRHGTVYAEDYPVVYDSARFAAHKISITVEKNSTLLPNFDTTDASSRGHSALCHFSRLASSAILN